VRFTWNFERERWECAAHVSLSASLIIIICRKKRGVSIATLISDIGEKEGEREREREREREKQGGVEEDRREEKKRKRRNESPLA